MIFWNIFILFLTFSEKLNAIINLKMIIILLKFLSSFYNETKHEKSCYSSKDKNIDFDRYIDTWILRIYRIYIDGYFYINIDISEIKLL